MDDVTRGAGTAPAPGERKVDGTGTRRLAFEDEIDERTSTRDVDRQIIHTWRTIRQTPTETSDAELLEQEGYFREGHLTHAGILIFAKNPSRYLPCARVHIAKFKDIAKPDGTTESVCVKDLILDGPIPRLLSDVEENVEKLTGNVTFFDTDGRFKKVLEYPRPAWVDGLMGALMHRSYRSDSYVHITIYEDSLQILSPGTPSEPFRPEMRTASEGIRNPRLTAGLAVLGYSMAQMDSDTTTQERVTSLERPVFDELDVLDGKSVRLTVRSNLDAWDQLLDENRVDGRMLLSPIYSVS